MAWFLFITFTFMLVVKEAASVDCPSGWLVHGQKCYHFSHDKEIWIAAKIICQGFGAGLAEVDSQDENIFLKNEVDQLTGNFWLGGNDLFEEGAWVWDASGTKLSDGYMNWKSGEPNNDDLIENCLEMKSSADGWVDTECTHEYRYICEKDPSESGASIVG